MINAGKREREAKTKVRLYRSLFRNLARYSLEWQLDIGDGRWPTLSSIWTYLSRHRYRLWSSDSTCLRPTVVHGWQSHQLRQTDSPTRVKSSNRSSCIPDWNISRTKFSIHLWSNTILSKANVISVESWFEETCPTARSSLAIGLIDDVSCQYDEKPCPRMLQIDIYQFH